ncbi:MAG: SDR family oxidoreductase [Balneolia bacterium]|nr:SDR family oxidoreductase [Balneolia bacterium]
MAISPESSIVITGASRGIGRSIAGVLASLLPNPLILISRDEKGLNETKKYCNQKGNNRISIFSCDLSKDSEVREIVKNEAFRNVSVLINNAGFYLQKTVLESGPEDYLSQFEANTLTAVQLTNALLPDLDSQAESRLIFTCSVTAQKGQARCGAYSASKSALNGYIQSMREALLDSSIAVTSIILGQTFSTSWDGSGIDPNRLADPDDVGRVIESLCRLSSRTCVEELVIRPQQGDL